MDKCSRSGKALRLIPFVAILALASCATPNVDKTYMLSESSGKGVAVGTIVSFAGNAEYRLYYRQIGGGEAGFFRLHSLDPSLNGALFARTASGRLRNLRLACLCVFWWRNICRSMVAGVGPHSLSCFARRSGLHRQVHLPPYFRAWSRTEKRCRMRQMAGRGSDYPRNRGHHGLGRGQGRTPD